jgi:hypothetical protein
MNFKNLKNKEECEIAFLQKSVSQLLKLSLSESFIKGMSPRCSFTNIQVKKCYQNIFIVVIVLVT